MRKLKHPIKFSAVPLLLLTILSILRMFVVIDMPSTVFILSDTVYPAIVNLMRHEIVSWQIFSLPINAITVFICAWIVGAIGLTARFFYYYAQTFRPIRDMLKGTDAERDKYAEGLLAAEIGEDKVFRVFRNSLINIPLAKATKPHIFLPNIELSTDELRVLLLHEWGHIRDKDYLTGIAVNVICFVFWWNPVVYILRWNFSFAKELKCDKIAVTSEDDFHHFLSGLLLLDEAEKRKANKKMNYTGVSTLANNASELEDRLEVLALQGDSRSKRILTNVCYSVAIIALFLASYTFIVLPAFWESSDICITTDDFTWEYRECGDVFRPGENFIIDNDDGTFSLYLDGQFVMYADDTLEMFNWLPIRAREFD
jgi:beta-lactamase regulating signal transducer with metallopeptidase domain